MFHRANILIPYLPVALKFRATTKNLHLRCFDVMDTDTVPSDITLLSTTSREIMPSRNVVDYKSVNRLREKRFWEGMVCLVYFLGRYLPFDRFVME